MCLQFPILIASFPLLTNFHYRLLFPTPLSAVISIVAFYSTRKNRGASATPVRRMDEKKGLGTTQCSPQLKPVYFHDHFTKFILHSKLIIANHHLLPFDCHHSLTLIIQIYPKSNNYYFPFSFIS